MSLLYKYQEGGRINKTLQRNLHLNFVQRMLQENPKQIYLDGSSDPSTHFMTSAESDGKFYGYPTVVEKNGELIDMRKGWSALDHALDTGEYIEFKSSKQAEKFAKGNWKKPTNKFKSGRGLLYKKLNDYKDGGKLLKNTDPLGGPDDPPKKLADQVTDVQNTKRFKQTYDPLIHRLQSIYGDSYNSRGWFNKLPAGVNKGTAEFLEDKLAWRTISDTPSENRVLPPLQGELKEMQEKILKLSDKQIKSLMSTDFSNMGVMDGIRIASNLGVGITDANRYINYFKSKVKQGYTFANGGRII